MRRLSLFLIVIILAGCNSTSSTPDPNGPILVGFATFPKALATIALTSTPNPTQIKATLNAQVHPTDVPVLPSLTPSTTPVLGVFMGASTFATGIGVLPTGEGIPFVIVTMPPGTKTTAVAPIGANPGSNIPSGGTPIAAIPGSLTPIVIGSPGNCSIPIGAPFVKPAQNPDVRARLGCPSQAAYSLQMVVQPFENGFMFWRTTKEIYVLSTKNTPTDTFWRFPDNWNETLPASDPSINPPAGKLQPVRGFGYIWRSNDVIKTSLGWALTNEASYQGMWQDFEHGWMFTANSNNVFAFIPADGPPPTTGIHFAALPE